MEARPKIPYPATIHDDSTILRLPGQYVSRKNGRILVVEPDSASWVILPEEHYQILLQTERLSIFRELLKENPGKEPGYIRQILDRFFQHGMILINGRRRFPPPHIMWPPMDDYPVYPFSIYFHTTDGCNFRCRYCYAQAESGGRKMDLPIFSRIIARALGELPGEHLYFEFHGGEPLLIKETIYQAVEYGLKRAREVGKTARFSIQTNGSLIDEKVASFARKYNVNIGVSLDGPQRIHDSYRVFPDGRGTFEVVWNAVRMAQRLGAPIGFLGVVHKPENYVKAFEFFTSRGIFCFKLNYSAAVGRASRNYKFTLERGKTMALGVLRMIDLALDFNRNSKVSVKIPDLDYFIRHLVSKAREYMCMRSPCGMGRSIIAFGPGGEIYPCEEMSSYREFQCGHLDDGRSLTEIIDSDPVIQRLRMRRVENIPKCKACPWRRFCGAKCTHKTWHYFGDIMREDPMCAFFSTLFEELMWKLDENPDLVSLM